MTFKATLLYSTANDRSIDWWTVDEWLWLSCWTTCASNNDDNNTLVALIRCMSCRSDADVPAVDSYMSINLF